MNTEQLLKDELKALHLTDDAIKEVLEAIKQGYRIKEIFLQKDSTRKLVGNFNED